MDAIGAALRGAAFVFCLTPVPAGAQDVTLTSRDGAIRIEGTLLGYDGEFYRVDSKFGTLTLDGSAVTCDGPGCPDLDSYVATARVSGATEIGRLLLPALIEAYAARNGLTARRRVESDTAFSYDLAEGGRAVLRLGFHLTSSDEGFADLIADEADLALSLREATPVEIARGRDAGIGDLGAAAQTQVLALDALVPIVATGNPLTAIGWNAVLGVLDRSVTDWTQFDGIDAPITLHVMAEDLRIDAVPHPDPSPDVVLHRDAEALADAVAGDPFALGLGRYSDLGNARALPLVGSCGFRITATPATLKTEDYPLTAPLFIYRPERRMPKGVREFLAFMLSPAAQPVIRRAGFVDQQIAEEPVDRDGRRLTQAILAAGDDIGLLELKQLAAHLSSGARLSPTFRFRDGTADLDPQSRSAVVLMAQALESGALDGARLEFIGFSDGNGAAAENSRLAQRRADAVLDAVRKAASTLDPAAVALAARSFGETLPILCDADDWGARANRRVEVWRFQR